MCCRAGKPSRCAQRVVPRAWRHDRASGRAIGARCASESHKARGRLLAPAVVGLRVGAAGPRSRAALRTPAPPPPARRAPRSAPRP
eukprot:scaffold7738_cov107-Isochrysis_galbana.AAC.20